MQQNLHHVLKLVSVNQRDEMTAKTDEGTQFPQFKFDRSKLQAYC